MKSEALENTFDEYDEYDRKLEEYKSRNNGLLEILNNDLTAQKVTPLKRREDIVFDADTYLNIFLLSGSGPYTMEQGVDMLDEYFGYFFIRKCMWSDENQIKSSSESVRLFYKSMMEHGFIITEDYNVVEDEINRSLGDWVKECTRWNASFDDDEWVEIL